jgi:hypothetical protein
MHETKRKGAGRFMIEKLELSPLDVVDGAGVGVTK